MSQEISPEQIVESVNGLLTKLGLAEQKSEASYFHEHLFVRVNGRRIPGLLEIVAKLLEETGCPNAHETENHKICIPNGNIANFDISKFEQLGSKLVETYQKRLKNAALVETICNALDEASTDSYKVLLEAMCGGITRIHMGLLLTEYLGDDIQNGPSKNHLDGALGTLKYTLGSMPREKQIALLVDLAEELKLHGTAHVLAAASGGRGR